MLVPHLGGAKRGKRIGDGASPMTQSILNAPPKKVAAEESLANNIARQVGVAGTRPLSCASGVAPFWGRTDRALVRKDMRKEGWYRENSRSFISIGIADGLEREFFNS
ncbi:hypothetical protein HY622_04030 [Candidatus Uhrbacteria bacterium]|nr:hypothetical protein [Candidatus Uhrbacteria bacterium]